MILGDGKTLEALFTFRGITAAMQTTQPGTGQADTIVSLTGPVAKPGSADVRWAASLYHKDNIDPEDECFDRIHDGFDFRWAPKGS